MASSRKWIGALCISSMLGLLACSETSLSVEELRQEAELALEKRDYKSAIIYYRNLVTQQDSVDNRIGLANVYFQVFNHNAATKEYLKAREFNADVNQWLIPLAVSWMTQGEYDKVLGLPVSLSKYQDVQADILALHAWGLLRQGELKQSQQLLQQATSLYPESQVVIWVSGLHEFQQQQWNAAESSFIKVSHFALQAESIQMQARVKSEQGQFEPAIQLLSQAQTQYPSDPRILVKLTNLLIATQKTDEVEKNLALLKNHFPNTMQQHLMEGKWLYVNRHFIKARDAFQKAAAIYPEHPEVNMFLGLSNAELSQWDKAVSHLQKTLSQYPGHIETITALAKVYTQGLHQPQKAVELLLGQEKHFRNHLLFQMHLIDAWMASGQFERAIARIDAIQVDNPDLNVLNLSRALAQYQLGDTDSAITVLQQEKNKLNTSFAAQMILTKMMIRENKFDQAKQQIENLMASSSDNPAVIELQAKLALARKDFVSAETHFERLVALQPKMKNAWIQLAGLAADAQNKSKLKAITARMEVQFIADPDVDVLRMQLAKLEKRYSDAQLLMEKIWQNDSSKVAIARELINLYLSSKPFQAEQIARQVVNNHPTLYSSHYDLGKVLFRLRKFDQADQSFVRALELNSEDIAIHLAQIEIYKAQNDRKKSERKYQQLRQKFPENQAVLASFIGFLIDTGAFEQASELIAKIDSESHQALLLGEIALAKGQFDQALSLVEKARSMHDHRELMLLQSRIFDRMGRSEDAVANFKRWLASNQEDAQTLLTLSDFQLRYARHDQALEGYAQLLKEYPDNLLLLNNMTWILIEQNDSKAMKFANQLKSLSPQIPAFIDTVAWAEILYGVPEQGISALENLFSQNVEFAIGQYHLAYGYSVTGRKERAKELLESLNKSTQEKQTLELAQKLLKTL